MLLGSMDLLTLNAVQLALPSAPKLWPYETLTLLQPLHLPFLAHTLLFPCL